MDWKEVYVGRFKDNKFKENEVQVCILQIVTELNGAAKELKVNEEVTMSEGKVSLFDCDITYEVTEDKIVFNKLDKKGQLKEFRRIISNKNQICISGKDADTVVKIEHCDFNLCKSIDEVFEYLVFKVS